MVLEHYEGIGTLDSGAIFRRTEAKVRAAFRSALGPVAGVGAVLKRLQIPTCVASSSDFDRVSFSLSLTGLEPHFDGRLYTSQMVKRGKPAPDLFLYAAEKMRADPLAPW